MLKFLIPFLILDLIVMALVLSKVLKLSVNTWLMVFPTGIGPVTADQMRALEAFSREQHARIGEYMRANWSGMADQLPPVLAALLDQLERDARAKGLPLTREILKVGLASSLRAHRVGRGHEVGEALAKVA